MSDIFEAIKSGDASAVSTLIAADPRAVDARSNDVSAVMTAVYYGRPEIAQLLIARGARVSFHEACALGNIEEVRTAIDRDPSLLDAKSSDGFPPLGLAIFFRQPELARYLIERGADVNAAANNAQRVAPVHAAAAVCDRDTMRLLLARGADPNARQQADHTALHGAASRGDIEMAKLLLEHGADPAAESSEGLDAAGVARKYGKDEFAEWVGGGGSVR